MCSHFLPLIYVVLTVHLFELKLPYLFSFLSLVNYVASFVVGFIYSLFSFLSPVSYLASYCYLASYFVVVGGGFTYLLFSQR